MPGVITDLRGRRFGRLEISKKAEPEIRNRSAYWPAVCDCGAAPKLIRGTALVQGRVVSCGCYRADPAVRKGGRLKLSAKKRQQIARMGGLARVQALARRVAVCGWIRRLTQVEKVFAIQRAFKVLNQAFFQVALPIMATMVIGGWAMISTNNRRLDDITARLGRIEDRLTGVKNKVVSLEVKARR